MGIQIAEDRSFLYTQGPNVGIVHILGAPESGLASILEILTLRVHAPKHRSIRPLHWQLRPKSTSISIRSQIYTFDVFGARGMEVQGAKYRSYGVFLRRSL